MKKYEYVVVSCTERNLDLVGSFDDKKDALVAMLRNFVKFHKDHKCLEDLYEILKDMELPDKKNIVDEVVEEILRQLKTSNYDIEGSTEFGITARECWSNLCDDYNYDCQIFSILCRI